MHYLEKTFATFHCLIVGRVGVAKRRRNRGFWICHSCNLLASLGRWDAVAGFTMTSRAAAPRHGGGYATARGATL